MKTFEIEGEFTETTYGKVCISVEAKTKEEALIKAENHEFLDLNTKTVHSEGLEFNLDNAIVTESD
jgi:hypothetical protein